MATAQQLENLRKARMAKARKAKGLAGFTGSLAKSFDTKNLMDALKKAGLVVAGFLIGKEGSEKLVSLIPGQAESSLKKYLPSLLQVGGGIVLSNQNNEELKFLGFGVLGSGILDGANKLTGKDLYSQGILKGIEGLGMNLKGLSSNTPKIDLSELKSELMKDYGLSEEVQIFTEDESSVEGPGW